MPTEAEIIEALRDVEDPELPVSIVDLGLVRGIDIDGTSVTVRMTFTSVACPCTHMIVEDVEERLLRLDAVDGARVQEVFEAWSREDVTPEGRAALAALAVI
ncbi:metal-sulfur cluster assembly factor [Bounagaea algeriensis]